MEVLKLVVQEAKTETPTIKSVRLALGDHELPFKPGQYCLVQLRVDGEMEDRALSIASAPTRSDSVVFASRHSESSFKRAFFSLEPGDPVTITGPLGGFVYDEALSYVVLLSGGIGITPLKSMVEYVCDRRLDNRVMLLFGNRSPAEIPFREELDELDGANPNLTIVHVVSSPEAAGEVWQGHTGRIDEALIRESVSELDRASYFICGPPGMVSGLRGTLEQMGVSKEQVKVENFAGYE